MAQIQNAIFYLDGAIFNLNALRYHYYALLCRSYGLPANKEEFYEYLENDQDKDEDILVLEDKIEDYVRRYCKKHGTPLNLGVKEYFNYLKTQNIQVIIYTTLDIKEAYERLKEENLTKYIHRIYSKKDELLEDSKNPIQTIIEHEEIRINETLIITGKEIEGSKHIDQGFHVVLVKDTVSNIHYRGRYFSYTVDLSNLISKMIIDKHDPLDLFSPILGFNKKMGKEELDQRYLLLKEHFKNDQKLMEITDNAYQQLCEVIKMDIPVMHTNYSLENSLTLEQDDLFVKPEPILKIEPKVEDKIEEEIIEEVIEEVQEETKEEIIEEPKPNISEKKVEEWTFDEDEKNFSFMDIVSLFFYYIINAVLFALILVLGSVVFALGFYPYFLAKFPWLNVLEKAFEIFHNISYLWVQLIYQSFASIMNLPRYDILIQGNEYISSFGISLMIYMITIVFGYIVIKGLLDFLVPSKNKGEDDD